MVDYEGLVDEYFTSKKKADVVFANDPVRRMMYLDLEAEFKLLNMCITWVSNMRVRAEEYPDRHYFYAKLSVELGNNHKPITAEYVYLAAGEGKPGSAPGWRPTELQGTGTVVAGHGGWWHNKGRGVAGKGKRSIQAHRTRKLWNRMGRSGASKIRPPS